MTRSLLAPIVVAALALTGCGLGEKEPEQVDAKELTIPAATGKKFTGTGYSLKVPKRWGRPPTKIPGLEDADLALFDLSDLDEFTDNLNVMVAPPGSYEVDDLDALEERMLDELATVGDGEGRGEDPVLVAGDPATHISGRITQDDVTYAVEQYHAVNDDQVYVVTFSFGTDASPERRVRVAESVLASWKWTA